MAQFFKIILAASLCLAAACLSGAAAGKAHADSMDGTLRKAVAEGFLTTQDVEGIKAQIMKAGLQGLPESLFTAKVEEGLAKRVCGQSIVRALEAMRDDYVFAREVLAQGGSEPTPQDLSLAGDSLRLGLSRQELKELVDSAQHAPAQMLATAARTRAYLNGIDFPPELSVAVLRHGLEAATLTPAWASLFKITLRARDAGMSDAAVAEAASRVLSEGGGLGELLLDLGFTSRDMRQEPGRVEK